MALIMSELLLLNAAPVQAVSLTSKPVYILYGYFVPFLITFLVVPSMQHPKYDLCKTFVDL